MNLVSFYKLSMVRSIPVPSLKIMSTNNKCTLIMSSIFLFLICSFNVIECCSKDDSTTIAPETTVKGKLNASM